MKTKTKMNTIEVPESVRRYLSPFLLTQDKDKILSDIEDAIAASLEPNKFFKKPEIYLCHMGWRGPKLEAAIRGFRDARLLESEQAYEAMKNRPAPKEEDWQKKEEVFGKEEEVKMSDFVEVVFMEKDEKVNLTPTDIDPLDYV
jgi:hypothetical protein